MAANFEHSEKDVKESSNENDFEDSTPSLSRNKIDTKTCKRVYTRN